MGIFGFLKKREEETIKENYIDIPVASKVVEQQEKIHEFSPMSIPCKVNNFPIAYRYPKTKIKVFNIEIIHEIFKTGEFEVNFVVDGKNVNLSWENNAFAQISSTKEKNMIFDWVKENEPVKIFVNGENTVYSVFYRDKKARMAYREQTVVALTNYKNSDAQDIITCLDEYSELQFDEDYTDNGTFFISIESDGWSIGRLPRSVAKRFEEQSAVACFFEKSEYDDNDKEKPYVRIFW